MNTKALRTHWQSLPEATLRNLQAEKLRRYLRDVVLPHSERTRRIFREAGVTADSIRSLSDLARLPFSSKADLVNTPEEPRKSREFILVPDRKALSRRPSTILRALFMGKKAVQEGFEREFRPIFLTSTTGRSADPIPFVYTRHDLDNLASAGRRLFEVCGARPEMRMLNMFPFAPHLAFWQTHYGGEAFGVFVVGTGGGKVMGTDGNRRMAAKLKPDVLIGMPTFVYHLLHEAVDRGERLEGLSKIVLGGEKVPEGMRRKLREVSGRLGAPFVDIVSTYGFTEAKAAWAECPFPDGGESPGFHLYPDLGVFEVIDPTTLCPVGDGCPGELVYTPLDARGSVALRYRTGDFIDGGLTHEPCPHCGRRTPRLVGRISRRSEIREMRLDKIKGSLVDFNELEHVLDDAPGIGAWQIELRKRHDDPLELDEVVLHVHRRGAGKPARVAEELSRRIAARTEIRPNDVVFHSAAEMRELHGVGVELKERRLVDHRPSSTSQESRSRLASVPVVHSTGASRKRTAPARHHRSAVAVAYPAAACRVPSMKKEPQ